MNAKVAALTLLIATAATAAAEQISVAPGQPLCIDQDNLAMLLAAAMQKKPDAAKSLACESVRPGSTAEVIERYPSGVGAVRVVKVKVSAPGRGPVVGYTFEVGPN